MISSRFILMILLSGFFGGYHAQSQPETDIYLLDIDTKNWTVESPINISNNIGYDNQPSFWPDGKSLLYSRAVGGQTEIARYFIDNGKTIIITQTLQGSEYSPTPTPKGKISSIRLDTTGLQLLYEYDLNGKYKKLIPDLVVGYHTWISNDKVVAFVLGEPPTMQVIALSNGSNELLEENIGRCIQKIPNSESFSFVSKAEKPWTIQKMTQKGESEILTETLPNSEDYCWTPTGEIIMGMGGKLFYYKQIVGWVEFADLARFEIYQISRIALSGDGTKIAIVTSTNED